MKKTTLFLMLACSLSSVHAQTDPPKVDWNLNKVLWSRIHHDPIKPGKRMLDFDMINNWQGLGPNLAVTPNGRYIAYDTYKDYPDWGAKTEKVIIQATDNSWKHVLPPGKKEIGFFTSDSKHFIFEDKEGLCLLELGTGEKEYIKGYKSYLLDKNVSCTWLVLSYENKDVLLKNLVTGKEEHFNDIASFKFASLGASDYLTYTTAASSPEFVLYRLSDGKTQSVAAPKSQVFSKDGQTLLLNQGGSLESFNVKTGEKSVIWSGEGTVQSPNFDSTGKQVVFTVQSAEKKNSIWVWKEGGTAKRIASQESVNAPAGFTLQGAAAFSGNGHYITYSLQKPADKYTVPKGAVELTLWSSRDQFMQSTQMKQKGDAATRNGYLRAQDGKVVYLSKQNEQAGLFGDCLLITKGKDDKATDRFWDKDYNRKALSLRNISTGAKLYLGAFEKYPPQVAASPNQDYAIYYDRNKGHFFSIDLKTLKTRNLCQGLKRGYFLARDYSDPHWSRTEWGTYDNVGWVNQGKGFIVYDDYDIWLLNPTGKAPINLTNGYGRKHDIIFQLEKDKLDSFKLDANRVILTAYNLKTKYNGLFATRLDSKQDPAKLCMGPYLIRTTTWAGYFPDRGQVPIKASNANVWIVKRQSPESGNNYYISKDLKSYKPLTSIVSHKNVNWYTRKLIRYTCLDGTPGEGMLYLPENFNPKKKYPVIMPMYERYDCCLYLYQEPQLATDPRILASNPAWLASHGYLVCVPNTREQSITYCRATFNSAEGAAKYLETLPYVAKGKIGAMTHSWSSKLGAYMFTHSKRVKAIWLNEGFMFGNMMNTAFAPTSKDHDTDMGTVETWGGGNGFGEFWKNKSTWIDQTTVLNLDKAQMPLMVSCGSGDIKNDTYVSQSFEIYNGLRRLNKPVWWFRYSKNCDHNFYGNERMDITIRMTQFFDHYLKGAPAPKWMTQGIPNKLVGVESERRLELDPKGSCGDKTCKTCKKPRYAR